MTKAEATSTVAVITGRSGTDPVFGGAGDFDLELLEQRTLDGNIQELYSRPTLHVCLWCIDRSLRPRPDPPLGPCQKS